MKNLILIALILTITSSFAADYDKIFCQEYDRQTDQILQQTVILTQTGEGKDKLDQNGNYLGHEHPYTFELYQGTDNYPSITSKGNVLTEDVNFDFTGIDKEGNPISFYIYVDELEESGLVQIINNDKKTFDFICRF